MNTVNTHNIISILLKTLFSLSLALSIIILATKFTLVFKPLYYFDIDYLNIEDRSGIHEEEIKVNYNYVIDYLNRSQDTKFKLPTLPFSKQGETHFEEVKNIFSILNFILLFSVPISLIGIYINLLKKNFRFLKSTSVVLISIPLLLSIPFVFGFDKSFVVFHKIFFRNDYWLFNPKYDPIINILPQEFFFHSALFILLVILLISILMRTLYKYSLKNTTK